LAFVAVGGGGRLLLLAGVRHPWVARGWELHLGFFPASIAIVGLLLGGALLLIALVSWVETRRPIAEGFWLVTLGRISLTLLMLHVVVFRELSRSIDYWWPLDPDYAVSRLAFEWWPYHGWRNLSASTTLAIIFGFVILSVIASRYWQRVGYRFGAEWLLRKVAG
ncbi:MAG: hypothetical protein KDK70_26985, partial [Myxococcales bacterium]|nr:hypothetical protein [Myxococcales bacterium]